METVAALTVAMGGLAGALWAEAAVTGFFETEADGFVAANPPDAAVPR